MISIVFPYLHSYAVWQELIFTLRSIEKNFTEEYQVFIFGDVNPKIQGVTYVEMKNIQGGDFSKAKDAIHKMRAIVNHPDITDDFLYWYDDILLLSKIDKSFFDNTYALHDMKSVVRNKQNNYMINLWNTFDELEKRNLFTFFYETHLPRLFNKEKMKYILDTFCPKLQPVLINTAYYNYYKHEPVFLKKDDNIKAGFYGLDSVTSFDNKAENIQVLNRKVFLNYNNKGLTEHLKKYIIKQFNQKCKYEK